MSYSSEVLADSPVAYWTQDETSGATAADSSGNGYDLTWSGAYTRNATSLLDDGTGKAVTNASTGKAVTASGSPFASTNITLEALISPTNLFTGPPIMTRDEGTGSNRAWQFNRSSGTIQFVWFNTAGSNYTVGGSAGVLTANVMNHVAVTHDGTTVRLYVNGTEVGSAASNGNLRAPTSPAITVANNHAGDSAFLGGIDEVAVYSTALSGARILAHYNAAAGIVGEIDLTSPTAAATAATAPATLAFGDIDLTSPTAAATAAALPAAITSGMVLTSPTATATAAALPATVDVELPPEPTALARAYSPSGARAIIPLTGVAPLAGEEPIERCSVLMAALSETHPTHARRDCAEGDNTIIREVIGWPQLFIGGRNVTYLRGVPVVVRRWESEVPFGDTAAAFEFPQLNPWDADGEGVDGDLDFLTKDAPVAIGIADGEGNVRRVWSGFLDARGNGLGQGEEYAREAKGTLWAAMHTIREPFPFTEPLDIGILIARTLNSVPSRRWAAMPETPIGKTTLTRGSRDQSHFDYVQELLSEAWTDDGRQWTLFEAAPEIFTVVLKPLPSHVDATVAYGTPGVEIDLRVDESTRVDTVYGRAIAPDMGGWANIHYPALELLNPPPYPNSDPDQYLNLGDTDAGTDSGTGVTDWQTRVREIGKFSTPAVSGVMTSAWVSVAVAVQRSIGVEDDGSVGPQTWNATFDRGGEGINMDPVRLPLASKPHIPERLYSATGVDIGPNPSHVPGREVPREIAVDFGPKKTKAQGFEMARTILSVYGEAEAFGTAEWTFDPNEIDRTQLTHLTNVKVTGHEGQDRVLMVVRKSVELEKGEDGPVYVVTTTLDQRARDAMAVEDLLEQKRSAQADPSRRPGNPTKSSRQVADQRTPWDAESPCGILRRTAVNGSNGLPSVITIPFAEVGKLARIEMHSTQPFAFLICASLRITENKAAAIVGDPFATSDPFRSVKTQLDEYGAIEGWGQQDQACGYSPGTEQDGYAFSGDFILDTPVDYWTETVPYVSVVIWMRGDSGFISGRFFPAYEGA